MTVAGKIEKEVHESRARNGCARNGGAAPTKVKHQRR